jgi:Grx4 family monothiol glutaredoxin
MNQLSHKSIVRGNNESTGKRTVKTTRTRTRVRTRTRSGTNDDDSVSGLSTTDFYEIRFEKYNAEEIRMKYNTAGIYAIYNDQKELQYIGLSRKVLQSIKMHCFELPAECAYAKMVSLEFATKEDLQTAWKRWVMEFVKDNNGKLPPGNTPKNELWADRKRRGPSKAGLRLTDGMKEDVTFDELKPKIQEAIEKHKIVAFIKGTREEPECGYSHRVINALNSLLVDYETVNVLDDKYNPNLLYVMKEFSDWPTIPQVYANNGEFLGGHDIIVKMFEKGELRKAIIE